MADKSTEPPTVPGPASPATAVDPTPAEDLAPAANAKAAPIVAVDPTVRIRKADPVSILTDISDR
jgi:hypothetical protein